QAWARRRRHAKATASAGPPPCRTRRTRWLGKAGAAGGRGAEPLDGSPLDSSLLAFGLRIVVLLGLHSERLVGGLRLFEDLLAGRLLGLLHFLDLAFLVCAAVPEECAAHVGALLRLGGTVMAGEGDTARVLRAREDFADRDSRILRIGADERRDVLVPGPEEIYQASADLWLEEPDELSVARVHGEKALLLAKLALGPRAVFGEHVRRRWVDDAEDPGLPHILYEEPRLRLRGGRIRLALVLEEGGHAALVAQGDRVMGLDPEDLGEGGFGLLEPAQLDVDPTQSIAPFDVVRCGLDDLLVQLRGARPVRLEGGHDGLVGESARAKAGFACRWHGSSSSA